MEFVLDQIDVEKLLVSDRSRFFVFLFIEPCVHFQPFLGSGAADQLHDDVECLQRYPLPVARDVAEKTVLDLVPFARARRKMAYFDFHARGVR